MIFLAYAPAHRAQARVLGSALDPTVLDPYLHPQADEELDTAQRRARVTALLLGREVPVDPRLQAQAALGPELTRAEPHAHEVVLVFVDGPPALLPEGLGGCAQIALDAEGLPAAVEFLQAAWQKREGDARSPRLPPGLRTGATLHWNAPSPVDRLCPAAERVPFRGWGWLLDLLHAWIEEPAPLSIRLICGAAGAGKTRLGLELARRRRARGEVAGFLDGAPSDSLLRALAAPEGGRWLIIVDEAAPRLPALRTLIAHVWKHPHVGRSVRLLLLARETPSGWAQLSDGLPHAFAVTQLQEQHHFHALLADEVNRSHHCEAALKAAGQTGAAPDLFALCFTHPLWVQMAALLASQGLTPPAGAAALASAVLEQERSHHARRIERLTNSPAERRAGVERLSAAFALSTLCGALPANEALTQAGDALGLPALPATLLQSMAAELMPDQAHPGGRDPRLSCILADHWIATHPQGGTLIAAALDGPQADQAPATLARMASDRLHAEQAQGWLADGLSTRLERLGPCAVALAAGDTTAGASEALRTTLVALVPSAPRPAVEALYAAACAQQPHQPELRAAAAARLLADWERDCTERWWLRLFGGLTPRGRAAALRDARAQRHHQQGAALSA